MVTTIKIKILSIKPAGCHLLIKAAVNGKTANLLIDTGASQTVFDVNRMNKFTTQKAFNKNENLSSGLGTSSMQSHDFKIKEFKLGELVLKNYNVLLLDLAHVNKTYMSLKLKPIDGVLGGDILKKYSALINYKSKAMQFSFKKTK